MVFTFGLSSTTLLAIPFRLQSKAINIIANGEISKNLQPSARVVFLEFSYCLCLIMSYIAVERARREEK